MSKINILPAQVYNRIAAGEVVDRPYSVVKELVENSIDAGATEIEIYVEKGGKELIRVIDNGEGIAREDLHAAFMPHATSKIEKASDLETIMTLGFRGEAVASIASVSKMTIASKTKDGDCYSLFSDGGTLGEIVESAGMNGTDVKVEMLFFNTPVRLGYLKSDKVEEADIIHFVSRFILNRSDIAFHLYVNGKSVLQSFGGGDEEAISSVYGAGILRDLYKIDAEKHGIKIRGYIGNQNFSKPNKTYQSVFLNGRYIQNATISAVMTNAYASYLMKRQFPFYVLHIEVPTEIVDVNVHPNKSDVRFANNRIIYGCLYNVVSAVLDGNAKALDYLPQTQKQAEIPFTYEDAKKEMEKNDGFRKVAFLKEDEKQSSIDDLPFDLPSVKKEDKSDVSEEYFKRLNKMEEEAEETPRFEREEKKKSGLLDLYPGLTAPDTTFEVRKEDKKEKDWFVENKRFLEEEAKKAKQNRIDITACRYAGKLFNTYLLYEKDEEFYIIDQHAAHERLIFDRLKKKIETRTPVSQPMLLPYKLDVNAFEASFIREHLENIRSMGFDIEEFGLQSFKISAVPVDLQDIDLKKFFNEILGDVSGFRSIRLESLIKDKLATAACKAAVKGGMDLSETEVNELFKLMDGNMGLKCPHGRPVVVRMTKTELEKMFKRIV